MEKKTKKCMKPDASYGINASQPDMNHVKYRQLVKEHYSVLRNWQIDKEAIEVRTREQSNCRQWKTIRKWVITASRMGRICKKRPGTSCSSIVSEILYSRTISNPALDYGISMEIVAKEALKDMGYNVQPFGNFFDKEVGIGGTPDGLIGTDTILEIKSPFTGKDVHPEEAIKNKRLAISRAFRIENEDIYLKENHEYYYQVQAQLRVTERKRCFFVIATLKSVQIITVVERNESFMDDMINKVAKFYREYLLPEIIDSRRKRKMPIRNFPECESEEEAELKRRKPLNAKIGDSIED